MKGEAPSCGLQSLPYLPSSTPQNPRPTLRYYFIPPPFAVPMARFLRLSLPWLH